MQTSAKYFGLEVGP